MYFLLKLTKVNDIISLFCGKQVQILCGAAAVMRRTLKPVSQTIHLIISCGHRLGKYRL